MTDDEKPYHFEHEVHADRDVQAWIDPVGGITIRAVAPSGDAVEISSDQARDLAHALLKFADIYDDV
jgi:hypothetical protein